jgi:hypothetical protein
MMAAPGLLISTFDSAAAAQKSNKPRKEASKKSNRNAHQRRGEISQKVTPESKAKSEEQRALDSEILKSTQEQDEKSAKSF